MQKTVAELAEILKGRVKGNGDIVITGLSNLQEAKGDQLSFLGNNKYIPHVVESTAGVVLLPENFNKAVKPGATYIYVENASAAFSEAVNVFAPKPITFSPGIHPTAVIAAGVVIPEDVHVGANVVIESGAVIGSRTTICAGTYIGHETKIGEACFFHPNVTIRERCLLGNKVFIHSGTVIGSDGFGYIPGENGHVKIPQVGIVQIDDDVELGSNVSVDRARFGRTWIKEGAKIDNIVHIAHNVIVGKYCFIVSQVGIAGSTELEDRVVVAGQVGIGGHLRIGAGSMLMGQAGVTKDLEAGSTVIGSPAIPIKEHSMNNLYLKKLKKFDKRLKDLENISLSRL